MLKAGIVGASGYTGEELVRILSRHSGVELTVATSRQFAGKDMGEVFPNLRNLVNITLENVGPDELADRAYLFFTAVPHQTAMNIVPGLLAALDAVAIINSPGGGGDFKLYAAAQA